MEEAKNSSLCHEKGLIQRVLDTLEILWGFTESDFATFALPDTAFGIIGALHPAFSTDNSSARVQDVILRLPCVLAFNWCNLLIFDMSNQRSAASVAEDKINKPTRPIPSGKITSEQTRWLMLATIPVSLAFHYYAGLWEYGLGMQAGIWWYNDLGGGNEAFLREFIIAAGYATFNHGSLQIALGRHAGISPQGKIWTIIISLVVMTTIPIQDLKDQAGDRQRGRETVVLTLGETFTRRSLALLVGFWTCVCAWVWTLAPSLFLISAILSGWLAWRILELKGQLEDKRTWQLWCFWHSCLYLLPLVGHAAVC